MRWTLFGIVLGWAISAGVGQAQEPPKVVVDIAPLHSLVAQVMGDVGQPDLLVPPNALPHDYALRPSQARDLEAAQIVFWVGPELTPWLADTVAMLSPNAQKIEMLRVPGTTQRFSRPGGRFGDGVAGAGDTIDPHAWLDPVNAQVWLMAIAEEMARIDPENAGAYRANALAGREELTLLETQIVAILGPVRDAPFIVYHDAFQHFEQRFGLKALGSVASGEATAPGVRRMVEMRALAVQQSVKCLFSEPQVNGARVQQVFDGSGIRPAVLDPLGAALAPGSGLYPALLTGIASSIADCLGS